MKKRVFILAVIVFLVPWSGLTFAQYIVGSDVVYGANGCIYRYGYPIVNLAEPICNNIGWYNGCDGFYGCMTLQYGDALPGCKPTRCPSCVNSGCCNCSCCGGGGSCTRP